MTMSVESGPAGVLAELSGLGLDSGSYSIDGDLAMLGRRLEEAGVSRPMVVCSRDAVVESGLLKELQHGLSRVDSVSFDDFTPNPTLEECVRAARVAAAHRADAVVGLGGGSAMDIAKLAALGLGDPEAHERVIRGAASVPDRLVPIFAVPTTSGTGAEATHFAAVYVEGLKRSVSGAALRPRGAILELRFHLVMPGPLAAVTGLDAMCQALESVWAVGATESSRRLAAHAAAMAVASIVASARRGDVRARRDMMIASHLAGHAIDISKTTLAHALSYVLTQRYRIPHGHAVALLLGAVAEANAARGAGERVGEALAHFECDATQIVSRMRSLLSRLGLSPTLADAGITRADLPRIARSVDPVRMLNNPAVFDEEALVDLLRRAWGD